MAFDSKAYQRDYKRQRRAQMTPEDRALSNARANELRRQKPRKPLTEAQKERLKMAQARYRDRHRDALRELWRNSARAKIESMSPEQLADFRARQAEYFKRYRETHQPVIKSRKATEEYKAKRREIVKSRLAAYRAEHPLPPKLTADEKKARIKHYRANNREKLNRMMKDWYHRVAKHNPQHRIKQNLRASPNPPPPWP